MKPSIGRIVHFVRGGIHYPAIVTKVWSDPCVNLFIFPNGNDPMEIGFNGVHVPSVYTSSMEDPGCNREYSWHWPEQVIVTAAPVVRGDVT